MKMKRSYLSVATRYNELCSKDSLTKSEAKELRTLRRTLESRGISTQSRTLIIDLAIVADNEKDVRGYLARHEDTKICKGRDVGRLIANQLEANALKNLGLSTTDHKRIAKMLQDISTGKKLMERKKRTNKRSIRTAYAHQPLLDEIEHQFEVYRRTHEKRDRDSIYRIIDSLS